MIGPGVVPPPRGYPLVLVPTGEGGGRRNLWPRSTNWLVFLTIYRRLICSPPPQLARTPSWQDLGRYELAEPLEAYVARDRYPVPSTADREGYCGERHFDYWLIGLKDYLRITSALAGFGITLGSGDEVLDFGCASGRTLRHFSAHVPGAALWATDVNRRHIAFVQDHLDPRIRAIQGTYLPRFPIADGTLSLVYAFSVFTHIDAFEAAWLAEIRRVLRPGGVAFLTIHSDANWARLNTRAPVYHSLVKAHAEDPSLGAPASHFAEPMPGERIVFPMTKQPHPPCNVFHSGAYIRRVWSRYLEVREIVHYEDEPQDAVVMQRE